VVGCLFDIFVVWGVSAFKDDVRVPMLTFSHAVDGFDCMVGHRDLGGMCPSNDTPCRHTHKVIATLGIPCGSECQCPNGAGLHGVVVGLMGMHIFPELVLAVMTVVKLLSGNDRSWANVGDNSLPRRKSVQPENCGLHHFNDESRRNGMEWEGVVCCPYSFLDGADVSLHFGYVFISGGRVEVNSSGVEIVTKVFEFSIHHGGADCHAAFVVYPQYSPEGLCNCFTFPVVESFHGTKMYLS